jgi:predicted nucleic acid-binding protein
MAASPKKSLALDTNVLLDLAAAADFAHEFKEEFQSRSYQLCVPPTVVAELDFFTGLKSSPQQDLARIALEKMRLWQCQPFLLTSTQITIALKFADRLIDASLIPDTERNDGKILAQSSLAAIPLLVTSDKHLLDIDEDELLLTFNEADLFPVRPSHPRRLLKALR